MPASHEVFQVLKSGLDVRAAAPVLSPGGRFVESGWPELDRALGGGFVRGGIGTLEGPAGRTSVAARMLAQATAGGLAAAIDDGALYPPHLERAGVRLERLLVMPVTNPLRAARAADILLRSRAFGVVVMPAVPLKATVWSRLNALAHKADAVLLVLGNAHTELGYFASTRVHCAIERVLWLNASGVFCQLAGYEIGARVLKQRRAAPGVGVRLRVLHTDGAFSRERAVGAGRMATVNAAAR